MSKPLILVVEDDVPVRNLITITLKTHGYRYLTAGTGDGAVIETSSHNPDVVLLDLGLPDMDGVDVIRKIRTWSNLPIIVISARSEDTDKIDALDAGADDYLTKPFNPLEVVARVKAILRRSYEFKLDEVRKSKEVLKVGELVLDEETVSLTKNGEEIQLTPTEFKILALLMSNPGRVYTKVQIYENINGEYFKNDDGALMVHIYRIREKIEADSKNPMYLKTVRGLGYKIEKI